MSKEARALLKKINDKKNAIKALVNEGKTKEAKEAKAELVDMQDRFNILMDLEDDEDEDIKDQIDKDEAKKAEGKDKAPSKKDIARAFVNRIVCGMRKTKLNEKDQKIMDAMSEKSDEDGGFTVPQDIQTDIHELRRTDDDLEQYVNVEPVSTLSGSRVFEVDADSTPWDDVDEGEEFGEEETPKLKQIKYKIKKKGGILKVTRELLQDTAENILGFLNKWIAKKSRATRNAAILKKLAEITTGKEVAISGYDDLKDVFNVTLDPAIASSSIVLTNQSGFNYLDKIKDEEKLEVTEEAFNEYLNKAAEDVKATADQLKNYFGEAFIKAEQLKEMATNLIVDSAKVKAAEAEEKPKKARKPKAPKAEDKAEETEAAAEEPKAE